MTRKETNKLILNFMEIEPTYYDGKYRWDNSPFFYCSDTNKESVINSIANYAKYDTSWDWLMPVAEKCFERYDAVEDNNSNQQFMLNDALILVNIGVLYETVVDFIMWYNMRTEEKSSQ